MAINLLRGRWWPIVCPTSGALRNVLKGCTPGAVRTLFLALTNYHGYIRLQVIILVTQVTRGLPELVQRWSINLVLLWYVEGKRPGSNCTDDSTWKWGGGGHGTKHWTFPLMILEIFSISVHMPPYLLHLLVQPPVTSHHPYEWERVYSGSLNWPTSHRFSLELVILPATPMPNVPHTPPMLPLWCN